MDAKEVGEYGKETYLLCKSIYKGDIKGIISSAKGILKLAGVFNNGKDNLTPNLTVDQKLDEMKDLLMEMDKKLDTTIKLQYDSLLQDFETKLANLTSDSVSAQQKIDKAMAIMRERDMEIPDENASDEEFVEFNTRLIKLMEDEEKADNGDFKNYTAMMIRLENEYKDVTAELMKDKEKNPLYYYDSQWALYFNWESQGYFLRKSYRTNIEFQIKRAYDLLSIYYQIPKYPDTHTEIIKRYVESLDKMQTIPPGLLPYYAGPYTDNMKVYSYTLKFTATELESNYHTPGYGDHYPDFSDDQGKAYLSRLHGNTVKEDLKLAFGYFVMPWWLSEVKHECEDVKNHKKYEDNYMRNIGFFLRGEWHKSKWRIQHLGSISVYDARLILWNGTIATVNTCDPDYPDEDWEFTCVCSAPWRYDGWQKTKY